MAKKDYVMTINDIVFSLWYRKRVTELTKEEKAIQYMKKKTMKKQQKHLLKSIEEDPDDPIGYVNFGNLLIQMQQIMKKRNAFY